MITFEKKDFPKVDFDVGSRLNITLIGTVSTMEKNLITFEPESVVSEAEAGEEMPITPTADDELEEEEGKPKKKVEKKEPKTPTADEFEELEEEVEEEEKGRR